MSRTADASLRDQLANVATRNRLPAQRHFGIDLNFESHLAAEVAEHVYVAGSFVAEAEVESFVNLSGMHLLL